MEPRCTVPLKVVMEPRCTVPLKVVFRVPVEVSTVGPVIGPLEITPPSVPD